MTTLFSVHRGRTNRAIFVIGLFFGGLVITGLLGLIKSIDYSEDLLFSLLLIIFGFLIELYLLYLLLCLWIRRLHDIDKSGWWLLLALIPPLNILSFLYLSFKSGNKTKNKYGEKPHTVLV